MKVELLAPAGDMQKLKAALCYGADAVYVGGNNFSLRALAGNFTEAELRQAVDTVHGLGKKIYVTLNIFARNNDFKALIEYVHFLDSIKVDAVIVSDLGVLKIVRENTNLEIHISTQANVLNKYTAEQYVALGAKRIILARECSLAEIKEICTALKGRAEVEVFVHGAMCMSYSGRCLLSDYIVGSERSSNRGACVQPCRFKYALLEEKRPGEYFDITEDSKGTYIMNSRDLCLIEHLGDLEKAGVTSFKIEGRTKSEYYVAGVVNTYRRTMNGEKIDTRKELEKISHRTYTTGFVFDEKDRQHRASPAPYATHEFVGVILDGGKVQHRNLFCVGDELEILSPYQNHNKSFTVTEIINEQGESIPRAKNIKEILTLKCPHELREGEMLRKKLF